MIAITSSVLLSLDDNHTIYQARYYRRVLKLRKHFIYSSDDWCGVGLDKHSLIRLPLSLFVQKMSSKRSKLFGAVPTNCILTYHTNNVTSKNRVYDRITLNIMD